MLASLLAFLRDRRGATAIEYALIAGSIALVIGVTVQSLGAPVLALFDSVNTGFDSLK